MITSGLHVEHSLKKSERKLKVLHKDSTDGIFPFRVSTSPIDTFQSRSGSMYVAHAADTQPNRNIATSSAHELSPSNQICAADQEGKAAN